MNDVPLGVDHDVTVMSVLELEQETQHTVSGHTHNEVTAGLRNGETENVTIKK